MNRVVVRLVVLLLICGLLLITGCQSTATPAGTGTPVATPQGGTGTPMATPQGGTGTPVATPTPQSQ
jgi:hypothetical protein